MAVQMDLNLISAARLYKLATHDTGIVAVHHLAFSRMLWYRMFSHSDVLNHNKLCQKTQSSQALQTIALVRSKIIPPGAILVDDEEGRRKTLLQPLIFKGLLEGKATSPGENCPQLRFAKVHQDYGLEEVVCDKRD